MTRKYDKKKKKTQRNIRMTIINSPLHGNDKILCSGADNGWREVTFTLTPQQAENVRQQRLLKESQA